MSRGGGSSAVEPPAARGGLTRRRALDAIVVVVLLVAGVAAGVAVGGGSSVTYDSFRDMAWAHQIAAGRFWADPVLGDAPPWYAPGNPLIMASVARVLGTSVVKVYRTSGLWWNAWLWPLIYLAVASAHGRLAGLLAVPFVMLGSLWWLTHASAAMPSIQGVALALVTVVWWQRGAQQVLEDREDTRWLLAAAAALAATAWVHPLCAIVAAGAIAGHALVAGTSCALSSAERWRVVRAIATVALPAGALASPLVVHLASLTTRNLVPSRYLAPELRNLDFALQLHAPLLVPLAVLGVVCLFNQRPKGAWILGYLAVGAVGQVAGYLHLLLVRDVPYLLPHEFQWHWQLAIGLCAAIGVTSGGRWLARRLPWPSTRWVALLLWVGCATAIALVPALPYVGAAGVYQVDVRKLAASRSRLVAWLRESTPVDAVVACRPQVAHLFVAGLAGRHCVAPPIGFFNPSIDPGPRLAAIDTILGADAPSEVREALRRFSVTHVVITVDSPADVSFVGRARQWPWLDELVTIREEATVVFGVRSTGSDSVSSRGANG